jgi:ferredoxin
VEVCPKDLFSLHPISQRLWVACKSQEAGDGVLEDCEVGCTACGKCAMDAPGLITMKYNLPVINYAGKHQTQVPIQRCPTGAIVWLDEKQGPIKGPEAKKIIRKGKLKMGES